MPQLIFDPSCTAVQQKFLQITVDNAVLMVSRAVARTAPIACSNSDTDYLRWFGAFSEERRRFVHRTYILIQQALAGKIEFVYLPRRKDAVASVVPGLKRQIRLYPAFWTPQPIWSKGKTVPDYSASLPYSPVRDSTTGMINHDTKPGVIIHELAHEVLRGGDWKYEVKKAENLAVNFPWLAARNADNYMYFAESV